MLMSQAAISAGSIACPRLGPAAKAALEASARRRMGPATLRVDMFHLPVGLDRPAREAVVVLVRETEHVRDLLGLAAHRDELRAGGLHVARLVPGAALQHRGSAVPSPRHAEP